MAEAVDRCPRRGAEHYLAFWTSALARSSYSSPDVGSVAVVSAPELHTDIAHLASLLGTWRGRGTGLYPTIETFDYLEEVTFAHVGKPFLTYSQKTRHAETNLPLHAESGYLRPVGADRAELVVAQPTGIVELHEGQISVADGSVTLDFETTSVVVTATASEVESVRRSIQIDGDAMTYSLDMAAVGLELQHHLSASLQRAE